MEYLELQYNRTPSQGESMSGLPYYEIPEGTHSQEWPWYGDMDPFWAWYFLLGGLFMVGGLIFGVVLLVAMLIWM